MRGAGKDEIRLFGKYGEDDGHFPCTKGTGEQFTVIATVLQLPLANCVPFEAIKRDSLAGHRAAVEIERVSQAKGRVVEEPRKAVQGEKAVFGRANDDSPCTVLPDETPVGQPLAGNSVVGDAIPDDQWKRYHRIVCALEGSSPILI